MSINLLVTERGQVTLPAAFRAKMGIKPGDVIVANEQDGGILLQAASVVPYREYSEEEIKGWIAADALSPEQIVTWKKAAAVERKKRSKK